MLAHCGGEWGVGQFSRRKGGTLPTGVCQCDLIFLKLLVRVEIINVNC